MFVRDYWKLTRLLVVCVVILGTSCDGNSTEEILQATTQKWLQNEEVESGTEGDSGHVGTVPSTIFPVRTDEGNWVSPPPASSGNKTKTAKMKRPSVPPLVSGNSAIRQLVTTPSKDTEASTMKSTEHGIPFPSQRGLDTSTLLPQMDETSFSELDDSEVTTPWETSDESYPTIMSTLLLDPEMTTLQSTDQEQSSGMLHSTDTYLYDIDGDSTDAYLYDTDGESTDAYLYDTDGESTDIYLYDNYEEESTDSFSSPSESSHTTVQTPHFTTKKPVDLVTTTVAVSLSTTTIDQITKQNKSTAHTNESYSSGPTQTQEINSDQAEWTTGQSISIIAGIAVMILAVMGIATICFIRRKTRRSRSIISSDNEKFFISRNQEDEPLSDAFLENKSATVGMYSDMELEIIEPSEVQDMVLNNVVHDEETKKPKCLEATTMIRDISE